MKAAKNDAIYKRADGVVIVDPVKAVGQKQLVEACPYGAIYWNEEKNVAQKCTFCAHLLDDGWKQPRCVQTCPMNCIYFGDLDDPNSDVSKFLAANKGEALNPEYKTKSRISYVGLPKPYVSGNVKFADTKECAGKVKVTLKDGKGKKFETETDFFGDFAFEDVAMGKLALTYEASGYATQTQQVEMAEQNQYVGEIALKK
jgi:NAD-dependent dihydropyrimidine dehydrogenase PreA subunit